MAYHGLTGHQGSVVLDFSLSSLFSLLFRLVFSIILSSGSLILFSVFFLLLLNPYTELFAPSVIFFHFPFGSSLYLLFLS